MRITVETTFMLEGQSAQHHQFFKSECAGKQSATNCLHHTFGCLELELPDLRGY